MYHGRIVSGGTCGADFEARLQSIHNLLTTLSRLVRSALPHAAPQEAFAIPPTPIATRYAAASPIARRRAEALLREAGVEISAGLQLVNGGLDGSRPGITAAAAFLLQRLGRALQRIDGLLPEAA